MAELSTGLTSMQRLQPSPPLPSWLLFLTAASTSQPTPYHTSTPLITEQHAIHGRLQQVLVRNR